MPEQTITWEIDAVCLLRQVDSGKIVVLMRVYETICRVPQNKRLWTVTRDLQKCLPWTLTVALQIDVLCGFTVTIVVLVLWRIKIILPPAIHHFFSEGHLELYTAAAVFAIRPVGNGLSKHDCTKGSAIQSINFEFILLKFKAVCLVAGRRFNHLHLLT